MLAELYVQNIAVIEKATIDFTNQLNIFTGETGAGKTVLISAINAILGERISRDIIRSGEKKAVITALFTNIPKDVVTCIEDAGYPVEDDEVLVSREITIDAKSKCMINGMPATISIVKSITSQLVTIHGQNDNQKLFRPENHIVYIDRFGNLEHQVEDYKDAYLHMQSLKKQIESLTADDAQKMQKIDLLTYQINEIEAADLRVGEDDALQTEREIIKNSKRILQSLSASYQYMQGEDEVPGILPLFDLLIDEITDCTKYIDSFASLPDKLSDISYELQEYTEQIRDQLDSLDFNPNRLEEIEERLDLIYRLKKKYGATIEEILIFLKNAQQELDTMQFSQEKLDALNKEFIKAKNTAEKKANALSQRRKEAANTFVKMVKEELAFLNMPSVKLAVDTVTTDLTINGIDRLEFLISTNKGDQLKPLAKIASGGEISRIMLAVQNVLSDKDHISTVIFDEIDTGVSGQTASKIGQKLKQVSKDRQVICVTHLAQVAAFADQHLLIQKHSTQDKTFTEVLCLDKEAKIKEIARILGGEVITPTTLQAANELITMANKIDK